MDDAETAWSDLVNAGASDDHARQRFLASDDVVVVEILRREITSPSIKAKVTVLDVLDSIADTRQSWLVELFPALASRLSGPNWLSHRLHTTILKIGPHVLLGAVRLGQGFHRRQRQRLGLLLGTSQPARRNAVRRPPATGAGRSRRLTGRRGEKRRAGLAAGAGETTTFRVWMTMAGRVQGSTVEVGRPVAVAVGELPVECVVAAVSA